MLRNRDFLRFFLAQLVSSLGDWIGVIAIALYAQELSGATGVGIVMTARVLPGFLVGPLAGVIADRFDRKRTMVIADIIRAVVIFSLPLLPNLVYLLLASVVLESLTLIWGPAKDAALPHFVKPSHLTHANSLSLLGVYGPWPLASVVYALLATLGNFVGETVPVLSGLQESPEALALWIDSLTFIFSAVMISTLTIPTTTRRAGRLDLGQVKRDLVEGLSFVVKSKKVRPWIIGIAFTFTAAGGVFSLGIGFVSEVLDAGDRGFAFLIGFLGTGMIIGLLAVGEIAKRVQKDVVFSASILLLGVGLIALASMSSLDAAIPIASALGFFGGAAYSTGYSLMHENTDDAMRGRTFSAAYTAIRIGTLVGLGVFPLIAGVLEGRLGGIEDLVSFGSVQVELPGSRVTLMIAGVFAIFGGFLSMRAIKERWAGSSSARAKRGYFVVFEGGEGAGKTTQIEAFVKSLEAQGRDVVATREPGGTALGARIRELLLDPENPTMDERAEALLYAADRAQHVSEIIKPSLDAGKIVVSDRFIDSSLAYQGLARGLGLEEIYRLSEFATCGLMPDIVFYMCVEPEEGMRRVGASRDRMEQEDDGFHERVGAAYLEIAERYPRRFVVIDGARPQSEVHADIVKAFDERTAGILDQSEPLMNLGPPGPVAR
ncbi:MAG: dTMP kinase [Actinomycetota bacterium]